MCLRYEAYVAYGLGMQTTTTKYTFTANGDNAVLASLPVPPGGNYAPPAPLRCLLCKAKPGTHLAGCPGDVAAQVQP